MDNPANSRIFELAKRYEKNPVVRALVQLIPFGVGGAADVALTTIIDNIREDRARTFFDELAARDFPLIEKEIQSEDFLHAYFATCKAALNTRRREKIRLFAQLLNSYAFKVTEFEEFEEHLSILDGLSYREFRILVTLKKYEEANPPKPEGENELQRADRFWDDFLSDCEAKLKIPNDEINGVLNRLNRTGLYQTIVGTYLNYTGDRGRLTSNFYRFIEQLKAANNE